MRILSFSIMASGDCGMVLVPNMVFTIEPMINAGGYKCTRLADGWTTVTSDGSLSAQWEHTVSSYRDRGRDPIRITGKTLHDNRGR